MEKFLIVHLKYTKTTEDIEIDRLNDILSTLIFELLNNNDMLR